MCNCPQEAVQRTVTKASAHRGRKFWTCDKPQGGQCGFFVGPGYPAVLPSLPFTRSSDDGRNGQRMMRTPLKLVHRLIRGVRQVDHRLQRSLERQWAAGLVADSG
jgi:hypothetical protein